MRVVAQNALIYLLNNSGHVLDKIRLSTRGTTSESAGLSSATVGRSTTCDLSAGDPHLAAQHAVLSLSTEGSLQLQPADTLNGVWLNNVRLPSDAPTLLQHDCELQLGNSRLRVRVGASSLAPELAPELALKRAEPEPEPSRSAVWLGRPAALAACAAAAVALVTISAWAEQTQAREVWITLTQMLIYQLAGVAVWVGAWALIGRVSRGKPHWLTHASIAFGVAALLYAVDWLIDVGAFAFSVLLPRQVGWWLLGGFGLLLLFLHVRTATGFGRGRAVVIAAVLPCLIVGLRYWQTYGTEAGIAGNQTPVVALFPPAMRLTGASSPDVFFAKAQAMKADILKKRDKQGAEDNNGEGDDFQEDD